MIAWVSNTINVISDVGNTISKTSDDLVKNTSNVIDNTTNTISKTSNDLMEEMTNFLTPETESTNKTSNSTNIFNDDINSNGNNTNDNNNNVLEMVVNYLRENGLHILLIIFTFLFFPVGWIIFEIFTNLTREDTHL